MYVQAMNLYVHITYMFVTCTYMFKSITYLNWPIWNATPALASPPNNRLPTSSRSISNLKFWLPLNNGSSIISRQTSSNSRIHRLRSWSPSASLSLSC